MWGECFDLALLVDLTAAAGLHHIQVSRGFRWAGEALGETHRCQSLHCSLSALSYRFIAWALSQPQVLPVNDTCVYGTWWDTYPYSSLSVFALHPLYLALRALRETLPDDIVAQISAARSSLDKTQVRWG